MNWKRGLFRMWLLFSALWLVFGLSVTDVAGLRGAATKSLDVPLEAISLINQGDGLWRASFETFSYDIEVSGNLIEGSPDWNEIRAGIADKIAKDIALENAATRLRSAENRRIFVNFALVPLALLLLGVALGWVAQGFRKPRT